MKGPLVSVIVPTWNRPGMLTKRCLPSIAAQTYHSIELIVVSDGQDAGLEDIMLGLEAGPGTAIQFANWACLPGPLAHEPRWGNPARTHGFSLAHGDFIAYLDDDDSYRPRHCEVLVAALLEHPDAGFVYSKMASHGAAIETPGGTVIGSETLGPCLIGTPMIMHRRALTPQWGEPDAMEDWKMVERWGAQGVVSYHVDEVTVDVYPQAYRGFGEDL